MPKIVFYRCNTCGNIIFVVKAAGGQLHCCNQPMTELVPNTVEASTEKHLPVITAKDGDIIMVHVGSQDHPMTIEHHIEWIALGTQDGFKLTYLEPEGAPEAEFCSIGMTAMYAYCNLHGLWQVIV